MIELAYWHWLILGMVLALAEIFVASFFLLWFGVAAGLVGLILLVWPGLEIGPQLLIWALLSIALVVLWIRYIRPLAIDRTKAGLSSEAILGETGHVLTPPLENIAGKMRFSVPILGAQDWEFLCEDPLRTGDRVRVVGVSGNRLIVKPS